MDRRTSKSIAAIKKAFEVLITKKKYSEITTQDILNEADVGRATFYKHFNNKEEVLTLLVNNIFEHVNSASLRKEIHHDFSHELDFSSRLLHMLYHFQEDKNVLKGILASESHDIFLDALKNHLLSMFEENVVATKENIDVPKEIFFNHLITSLMEIVLWWIKDNNCERKPTEIADYYFKLTSPVFKK